ncbi:hypothetical protein EVAR_93175_1 [Eumeta japonica]|uniref:Uncharacterized protein n=1 Tax=Eumeta variegata TaxID=151549 RepID=A0A4C1TG83_EUMVA|nr:hypothetical protein EVAR_93175_1 [Eumeta japonica]
MKEIYFRKIRHDFNSIRPFNLVFRRWRTRLDDRRGDVPPFRTGNYQPDNRTGIVPLDARESRRAVKASIRRSTRRLCNRQTRRRRDRKPREPVTLKHHEWRSKMTYALY